MKELIVFTISKEEVSSRDFSRFEQAFGFWPELRGTHLRERFDSITLLIDGFNESLDEIYTIPKVRHYMAELHRRWPWWLFFIHNHEANIAVYYMCLLKHVECFKEASAATCAAAFSPDELLEIIKHDFERMNYLFDRAGMSDSDNDKRSDEILGLFTANIGGANNG